MASQTQGGSTPDPKSSEQFRDGMKAAVLATRDLAKDMNYVLESLRDSAKELNKVASLNKDFVGSSKKLQELSKGSVTLTKDLTALYDSELQIKQNLVLKQTMLNTGLKGEYAQLLTTYMIENGITDANDKRVQLLIAELKRRQGITDQTAKQVELAEALAEWQLELNEELEKYEMGWEKIKSKIKAVVTDPKVAKAVFLTSMAEKSQEVYENFEKLGQSGLTVGQRVDYMTKGFSLMSAMGLSDTKGVLDGMVETMGTMNSLTSDEVDHVGHLAKEMGVTGQEAFGLVEGFSKLPGETMETAAHAADYVKSLSKANGVAPGKITKEIAKNTELIALGGYKGAKAFTDAAMKAQKMGVELQTTSKVMNGLLNFENSLNKQMEASVLLGKEINLDKARQLALEGKSVEATEEVLKNIGGQAAFDKMNVLQKQALAEATGMTVEELNKAVDAQVEYNKYHGEDVAAWKTGVGYAMEFGGAAVKIGKEYGMMALSLIQMVVQMRMMKALQGDTAKSSGGFFSKMFGGGKSPKIEAPAVPKTDAVADAGKKMGGGGMMAGFKSNMKALADGFKEMAGSKVSQGIGNVAKAGPAMVLGIGALPFMGIVALLGTPAGAGLQGLSEGLKGKGMGAALVATGVINLTEFALAGVIGIAALPFMFVLMLGKVIGAGLKGLAGGLRAMGDPVVAAGAVVLSGVLLSAGASMLMFGAGVGIAAAGMSLLVTSLKDVPFDNLIALPIAFMGMAAGLGMIAVAGLAALPVLGALTALAVVAPALTGLGLAIGGMFGGGEGEKEDKMDELIAEVRAMRVEVSKGGTVNMDGKKVGDALRLYGIQTLKTG